MGDMESFAFYYPHLNTGGAQKFVTLTANELCRRGYSVDLVVWDISNSKINDLNSRVNVVIPDNISKLRGVPSLIYYLFRNKPDYLITRLEAPNVSTILSCSLPMISTSPVPGEGSVREKLDSNTRLPDRLTRKVASIVYPSTDYFLTSSNGLKKHIVDLFDIPSDSVYVCPPPVLDRTQPPESPPVPHEFFHENEPVIVSVGRLAPEKRYSLLLRSFAQLQENIDVRLLIVGSGEQQDSLNELAADLGISDRVSLPGYSNKPLHYMHHADVFALTSKSESFGIVIAEALACGTPVVSTDVPYGPSEILNKQEYGILTKETPESVRDGLRKALAKDWDQEKLQNRGQEFGVQTTTDRLLRILRGTKRST